MAGVRGLVKSGGVLKLLDVARRQAAKPENQAKARELAMRLARELDRRRAARSPGRRRRRAAPPARTVCAAPARTFRRAVAGQSAERAGVHQAERSCRSTVASRATSAGCSASPPCRPE